ncbi:hemoglobin subunit alpha-1-like [Lacerta agilis]|uniref:hemoglobin subunit alpha-1-like n=1 Tax=Lacerta agilis TaxID=80427 RepID=UPI0014197EDD|nr:hemoglobin subunit alpha-1-like [Lacerta agilis]
MWLTDDDKSHVKAVWGEIQSHARDIGAEPITRRFAAHPTTKTYFVHIDVSPGSGDIKAYGKKVTAAIGEAVAHIDNIAGALNKLSNLHTQKLHVDPINFALLGHCILVAIAANHPGLLKASTPVSMDKFLGRISAVLLGPKKPKPAAEEPPRCRPATPQHHNKPALDSSKNK